MKRFFQFFFHCHRSLDTKNGWGFFCAHILALNIKSPNLADAPPPSLKKNKITAKIKDKSKTDEKGKRKP